MGDEGDPVIVQLWRVAGEASRLCDRAADARESLPPAVRWQVAELQARLAELRALDRRRAAREGVRHAG